MKLPETAWLHVLWRKSKSYVFFHVAHMIFTLVDASTFHFLTAVTKFHVAPPTNKVSFAFLSRSSSFSPRASLACRPTFSFLCLPPSLYSKFVDMTINLSLVQHGYTLSVFVFIDSLVVFASQNAGGRSRQNNLTFDISLHVVGVGTVGVRVYATS